MLDVGLESNEGFLPPVDNPRPAGQSFEPVLTVSGEGSIRELQTLRMDPSAEVVTISRFI